MNPSNAIAHLKLAGMTEVAIAAKVGSRQSTINRILHGGMKPNYELGKALVDLALATPIHFSDPQADQAKAA